MNPRTLPLSFDDFTHPELSGNLAIDEALLLAVDAGEYGEWLRLWSWPRTAVVLGANGVLTEEVHLAACQHDGIEIVRRSSGGGTVLLGAGCLQYTLVLNFERRPELHHVGESYQWIAQRLAHALQPIAPIELLGSSDLCWQDRKFSGNAQQRKTRSFLHHGTLLYQFDSRLLERYLKRPPRQPEYRANRDHASFVINLPTDHDTLKQLLIHEWDAERVGLPKSVLDRATELMHTKYGTAEWIQRR